MSTSPPAQAPVPAAGFGPVSARRLEVAVVRLLADCPEVSHLTVWCCHRTGPELSAAGWLRDLVHSCEVELAVGVDVWEEEGLLRLVGTLPGLRSATGPSVTVLDAPGLSDAQYEVCLQLHADGVALDRALSLAAGLA